jgi:hypothetical protein
LVNTGLGSHQGARMKGTVPVWQTPV